MYEARVDGPNVCSRPEADVEQLKCLIKGTEIWQIGHTRSVLLNWPTFMLRPKQGQNQYQTLILSNGLLKRFGQRIAGPSLNRRLQLLPLDAP